tara:strand:+ start:694 stop:1686 length:993 start_codon:yes stop_codon:yes gene_type:complete
MITLRQLKQHILAGGATKPQRQYFNRVATLHGLEANAYVQPWATASLLGGLEPPRSRKRRNDKMAHPEAAKDDAAKQKRPTFLPVLTKPITSIDKSHVLGLITAPTISQAKHNTVVVSIAHRIIPGLPGRGMDVITDFFEKHSHSERHRQRFSSSWKVSHNYGLKITSSGNMRLVTGYLQLVPGSEIKKEILQEFEKAVYEFTSRRVALMDYSLLDDKHMATYDKSKIITFPLFEFVNREMVWVYIKKNRSTLEDEGIYVMVKANNEVTFSHIEYDDTITPEQKKLIVTFMKKMANAFFKQITSAGHKIMQRSIFERGFWNTFDLMHSHK